MHFLHKNIFITTALSFVCMQSLSMVANSESISNPGLNLGKGTDLGNNPSALDRVIQKFRVRRYASQSLSIHRQKKRRSAFLGYFTRRCAAQNEPCPTWTSWTGLDSCNSTCGGGYALERRYCQHRTVSRKCRGISVRLTPCNSLPCPTWTSWYPTSECSNDCSYGQRLLKRNCSNDLTDLDGCEGPTHQIATCFPNKSCSPKWNHWAEFSNCSVSCGTHGTQTRRRQCLNSNGNVTSGCLGPANHTQSCNAHVICPLKYSPWSHWGRCDVACGNWTTINRRRRCLIPPCSDEKLIESRVCGWNVCRIISNQTEIQGTPQKLRGWSAWSPCSESCGREGLKLRGMNCTSYNESIFCEHRMTEVRVCSHPTSCPTWAEWSRWTDCGGECRNRTGTRLRHRLCTVTRLTTTNSSEAASSSQNVSSNTISVAELVDTELCQGGYLSSYQEDACSMQHCNPFWDAWSRWSSCSSSCGQGYKTKTRHCNSFNNSSLCSGGAIKYQTCFSNPCWSAWSVFTPCTTSCGSDGVQSRRRKCIGVAKRRRQCEGNATETIRCNTEVCPVWSNWTVVTACSVTCGAGIIEKRRECLAGNCEGRSSDMSNCYPGYCPIWSPWNAFTCCGVTCGQGFKMRSRMCIHARQGQGCVGDEEEVLPCDAGPCNATVPALGSFTCGRRRARNFAKASVLRIFGGTASAEGTWPWQVSLQLNDCGHDQPCWEPFCGGVLIAPQWVLSAGHCPYKKNIKRDNVDGRLSIVMGVTDLTDDSRRIRMGVRRVVMHPRFRYIPRLLDDVVLIKLERPVESPNVMPACLPGDNRPQNGERCYITGWGGTEHSPASNALLQAEVPIYSIEQCRKLSERYNYYVDDEEHLCAGDPVTAATDTCGGDSGGPISCLDQQGNWYVAGITSFGLDSCGTPENVGVYASINSYQRWIRQTLDEYVGC